MARCSLAKPLCAATAAPQPSHRRHRHLAANAASPAMPTSKARLPTLKKSTKPPPPLLSRPKLPVPTTTTTTDTHGNEERSKKSPPDAAVAAPSPSGAGDVLRLLDTLRFTPDEELYISLLRDCAYATEVAAVHVHISVRYPSGGLPLPLANRVLLSYAASGDIGAARRVFDEMPVKNGLAWAMMISAYSDGWHHQEAMLLFVQMCHQARGLTGDCYAHAIVAVLRSCARAGELRLSEQVHSLAIKKDRVFGDIGCSLVQLYCDCGGLHKSARLVLVMMMQNQLEPVPEAAWTNLITACHRDGLLNEAIDVFRDMVSAAVPKSSFSLSSILAVFAESEHQGWSGQQVHADTIKRGVDTNQFVGSGLVHMYAKQGQLVDAARAFEAISGKPDSVCWNAMAMAYARGGKYREATRVIYQMKAAGVDPSEVMLRTVRSASFR